MSQPDLDALCEANPDCLLASFADADTGVVMLSNSTCKHKRDYLMSLCKEATILLGKTASTALLSQHLSNFAVLRDHAKTKVFLRNPSATNDILLCVCRPDIDIMDFREKALETLMKISRKGD